jgi:hypothetical protein
MQYKERPPTIHWPRVHIKIRKAIGGFTVQSEEIDFVNFGNSECMYKM